MIEQRVPSVRLVPSQSDVYKHLGLLAELAGTWEGEGFNLIGRPDFEQQTDVFLELNPTTETLRFEPISSPIPNRGTFQDDQTVYGLTYLQKVSDSVTGGALHIEPGIWITQLDPTTEPPEAAPAGAQIVKRLATIPHGNAVLAEGIAEPFQGDPVLSPGPNPTAGSNPAFSKFPAFNSTPFLPAPPILPAAGSAESAKPGGGFKAYTLANPEVLVPSPPVDLSVARTPLGNVPGVPTFSASQQEIINDPIVFLQNIIKAQKASGHTFHGVALNIATEASVEFFDVKDTLLAPGATAAPPGTTTTVRVPGAGGGIENTPFLQKNALTALVYATFWIETVSHVERRESFQQLQYAQMVVLNFPAQFVTIPGVTGPPNISWPHITVGSLRRVFG